MHCLTNGWSRGWLFEHYPTVEQRPKSDSHEDDATALRKRVMTTLMSYGSRPFSIGNVFIQ
jgi:hypothetical protein